MKQNKLSVEKEADTLALIPWTRIAFSSFRSHLGSSLSKHCVVCKTVSEKPSRCYRMLRLGLGMQAPRLTLTLTLDSPREDGIKGNASF
eukprot:754078-Amphidinium_carterae.1